MKNMIFILCGLSLYERWKWNYRLLKYFFGFILIMEMCRFNECLSTMESRKALPQQQLQHHQPPPPPSSPPLPLKTNSNSSSRHATTTVPLALISLPSSSTAAVSSALSSSPPSTSSLSSSPITNSLRPPSNESELDIIPNFLIKQTVPTIRSYFRSSSLNSHPVKHNDTDTDFFVSDKTKNYSKLIYQDINLESLDDDFGDSQNHVDKDNSNGGKSDTDDDDYGGPDDHLGAQIKNNMYFGTVNFTNVSTQIGAIASVPCSVHHIGDGVVTWIRKKDYHLLTVGLTTYSSDERFSTVHLTHSEDWTLQIKFVQLRDAGIYECQVSTHPPTSIFIKLDVIARAEIVGPSEKFIKPGSILRLVCNVEIGTEPPMYIFWYHNNRMINYDTGVSVVTEPDNRNSELTIAHTSQTHTGNYSCVPDSAASASTYIHIFNAGENPAAIHHVGDGSRIHPPLPVNILLVLIILSLIRNCDV